MRPRIPTFLPLSLYVLLLILPSGARAGIFPKNIEFKVTRGNLVSASFSISFEETSSSYLIRMERFAGLGFTSDQQFWSEVSKDLSLKRHAVVRKGEREPIREVRLDPQCKSFDQRKTHCFKYSEGSGDALQTEIFTEFRAIDFISSMLVATQQAARGDKTEESFNFIFNKATKQVRLVTLRTEKIQTRWGKMESTVLALVLGGTDSEIYRFYIGERDSGYFPLKMIFTDDSDQTIEFVADDVIW